MVRAGSFTPWGLLFALFFAGIPFVSAQDGSPAVPSRFKTLWQEADALQTASDFAGAADRYRAILTEFPRSQRAALRIAICEGRQGHIDAAITAYDAAINMAPQEYWAEAGLYFKARDCVEAGKTDDAHQAIERLKTEHPDSSYTIRSGILEAQLEGRPTSEAEARFTDELQAAQMLEQAQGFSKQSQDGSALAKLTQVISQFPDCAATLRAREATGHILIRQHRPDEAVDQFSAIVERVGGQAPGSRIVQTAKTRLAALHHKHGKALDAIALYEELVEQNADPAIVANATLHLTGIKFELLQRKKWREEPVSPENWQEIRDLCNRVLAMEKATSIEKARAELMLVESFQWQGDRDQLITSAQAFLSHHEGPEVKREIATVRLMLGEGLFKSRRAEEALPHFRWIIEAYAGEDAIWPGMDHLPRAYYRLWQTLQRLHAPAEQVEATAQELLEGYPESSDARLLQGTREQLRAAP